MGTGAVLAHELGHYVGKIMHTDNHSDLDSCIMNTVFEGFIYDEAIAKRFCTDCADKFKKDIFPRRGGEILGHRTNKEEQR